MTTQTILNFEKKKGMIKMQNCYFQRRLFIFQSEFAYSLISSLHSYFTLAKQ